MHIHLDLMGGIAGDMFLAAAIDADLVDIEQLETHLQTLGLGEKIQIYFEKAWRGAMTGTHVQFKGWDPEAESDHRYLSTILEMIAGSSFPDGVKQLAVEMFNTLGEAEAKVHGIPLEKVHFHEVGAVDSILDFLSAAWVIQNADATWSVGEVPTGKGTIETAHGQIPVPAPATSALLLGFELVQIDVEAELVTPTGAAILKTVSPTPSKISGRLDSVGYGAGTRDIEGLSNVVRMLVFKDESQQITLDRDVVAHIECEIDDMNPEILSRVAEQVLPLAGALDVVREPVYMKKGRMGTRLSVLCTLERRDDVIDCLLRETSTFGVRVETTDRFILRRRIEEVSTDFGKIRVKIGSLGQDDIKATPEYDDCVVAAAKHGVSVSEVYSAVTKNLDRKGDV